MRLNVRVSKKLVGLTPGLGFLLCGVCMFSLCLCGFSSFLQKSKNMHVRRWRWIGNAKSSKILFMCM